MQQAAGSCSPGAYRFHRCWGAVPSITASRHSGAQLQPQSRGGAQALLLLIPALMGMQRGLPHLQGPSPSPATPQNRAGLAA